MPLVALLASCHQGWSIDDGPGNIKSRKNIKDTVKSIVELAYNQFLKRARENHGIKEENIRALIVPTGIDMTEFDPAWIIDMNNFGKSRGDAAHNTKLVTKEINPKDELQMVENLLPGLEFLDQRLCALQDNPPPH